MGPAQAWFRGPFRNLFHRAPRHCTGQANSRKSRPIPRNRRGAAAATAATTAIKQHTGFACEKNLLPRPVISRGNFFQGPRSTCKSDISAAGSPRFSCRSGRLPISVTAPARWTSSTAGLGWRPSDSAVSGRGFNPQRGTPRSGPSAAPRARSGIPPQLR
jgi:hypothetical protein